MLNQYVIVITVLLISILATTSIITAHETHPLGKRELDWQAPHIKRVVSIDRDVQSGAPIIVWSNLGRIEQIDDRSCLVGPHFLFDVDEQFAFDIDESIELELLFDRAQTDGFTYSYDHSVAPVAKTIKFKKNTSERWHIERITLERARFANRKHVSTDFSIAALGAIFPYNPDNDFELALCGLEIKREYREYAPKPAGTIQLELTDASSGKPGSARVGLYDHSGRMPLPGDDALTVRQYNEYVQQLPIVKGMAAWPGSGSYVFYVDGTYQAAIPAGTYELIVTKGPEYKIYKQQITIKAGSLTNKSIRLQRWIDMPAKGWYSGDSHIHIERMPKDNESISRLMTAEDIHVASLLQMSNLAQYYFSQYAFGKQGYFLADQHALVSGQESPRSGHRGHTIGLNGSQYHHPGNYFLYHQTGEAIRKDGGLFGYAHVSDKAFHATRGLAIDVPMGVVDFVEVLQRNHLDVELWYDFLNLGFKLNPTAGSDFPYLNLPGTERMYVYLANGFTPQAWFAGLRKGSVFVTNAPVVDLRVNGLPMGAELAVRPGENIILSADARLNPDFDKLDRMELVVQGEVVKIANSQDGEDTLTLHHEFPAKESSWLAIRVYGKDYAVAHTAPVYIYVDGDKNFSSRSKIPSLVKKYKNHVKDLVATEPILAEDNEQWDTGELILPLWQEQLAELKERAKTALKQYDQLLVEANSRSIHNR